MLTLGVNPDNEEARREREAIHTSTQARLAKVLEMRHVWPATGQSRPSQEPWQCVPAYFHELFRDRV